MTASPGATPRPTAPAPVLTTGDPPARLDVPRWMILLLAVLGQFVLTEAMLTSPIVGFIQAALIVALALYASLKRDAVLALCVLAYLPCAEILWRQAGAPVPYLMAPYTATAIALLMLLTTLGTLTSAGRLAVYYFLLLVPSTVLTIATAGPLARQLIAFAMSGPLAAATLIILCSQISIERWLYKRLLWIMLVSGIGPLVAALTSIDQYISENGAIAFDDQSNFITSGGFGPVQVSSLMGLTVLVAVLAYLIEDRLAPKLLAIAIGLAAAVFSFLTFSRGGMTATALALAAFSLVQARDRDARWKVLSVVVVTFAVGFLLVVPRINAFTDGAFEKRFSDTSSGRTELASNDLEVFRDHPAFGVGPGMTKYNRLGYDICELRTDRCAAEASSHTEFTRMLGEHGLPGLLAIGVVLLLGLAALTKAGASRPLTVAFLVWAVAQMFYANFRVLGIAFAFAFAFVHVRPSSTSGDDEPIRTTLRLRPEPAPGTRPGTPRPAG